MAWRDQVAQENYEAYNAHLWSESDQSALNITPVAPEYADDAPGIPGREILKLNFEQIFDNNPLVSPFLAS